MKLKIIQTSVMLVLLAAGLQSARAQFITNDFSFSVMSTVPDGNASGLANHQFLAGMTGTITNVSVTLNLSYAPGDTAFNGDLYAYLAGPNGGFAILLNRTGVTGGNSFGYDDTGFNVAFTTSATHNIHFYQSLTYNLNGNGQLTGTWQPDGRAIDPQSSPSLFDSTIPSALLDSFNGTDPNGTWTLFLADLSNGGKSQLVNWNLQVSTVPEPPSWTLFAMGAAWLVGGRFRQKKEATLAGADGLWWRAFLCAGGGQCPGALWFRDWHQRSAGRHAGTRSKRARSCRRSTRRRSGCCPPWVRRR